MKRSTPTAAEVLRNLDGPYLLGKRYRRLPADVIRGVLGANHDHVNHLFVRLAIPDDLDDDALAAAWERAVQALVDTDLTCAWGSKPRRERIRRIARDPELLAAVQGTVAHRDDVRLDLLAVLVADGSAASYDALVRHIDAARVHGDVRVDRLAKLRIHAARTPVLDALFAELDATLVQREDASPALALGPLIGLGGVESLWFSATLGSRERSDTVPRVQGDVRIDSRKARWFGVSMSRREGGADFVRTSFDATKIHQDALQLGRCDAAELPAWLARVAAKLKIEWNEPSIRSGVRGAKREQIAHWLLATGSTRARRRR